MIVNGKEIANDIKEQLKKEIKRRKIVPTLFIFSVGENSVSEKFLAIKKKFAYEIGVSIAEKHFNEVVTEQLVQEIVTTAVSGNCGVIVQLPLPQSVHTASVLNSIPTTVDVDVLSSRSFTRYKMDSLSILPPVVGAMKEILFRHNEFIGNKNIVIVGRGRLVGEPAAIWFKRHGGNVSVLGRDTKNFESFTKDADIIVLGAGSSGLLKPYMIKREAVVLDAGTSEVGGKMVGDADPACASTCRIFTPTPGGIGPVTVAMLFVNLLALNKV